MTETVKAPKRGWVKNAAIIFLTILLLLTFFSNTIMNASLPEVSTATANSGQITSAVRGSGAITANETYELKLKQTRTVESVLAKVGDTVEEGQLLFTLKGEESSELSDARAKLQSKRDEYQLALITDGSSKTEQELKSELTLLGIRRQEEDLEIMTQEREKLATETASKTAEAEIVVAAAKIVLADAKRAVTDATAKANDAKRQLDTADKKVQSLTLQVAEATYTLDQADAVEPPKGMEELYAQLDSAYDALRQAQDTYNILVADPDASSTEIAQAEAVLRSANEAVHEAEQAIRQATGYNAILQSQYDAYRKLQDRVKDLTNQLTLATARSTNLKNTIIADTAAALESAEKARDAAQVELDAANKTLTESAAALKEKDEAIKKATRELETALIEYNPDTDSATTAFNLNKMLREISELERDLKKLEAEGESSDVTSPVAGLVKSITVTPGNDTKPDTSCVNIEMTDRGYYITFSVTNAQAQTLAPGAEAAISGWYWGPERRIVLANIGTDPDAPRERKKLLFTVSGEQLESGETLNIEVGGRSGNYDQIVPNTAVHTDSEGSFVLIVDQKQTPLGTRYIAKRVDVTVLAKDDVNSAVSGGLGWGYVITVSSAPVEAGQYIRLADK
ncbi:MAG: HlyD family efflux transporter periplasmic adaptor subunit [Oscillospiraceae bacterium]|jgi:multidrug resistance efflux pump|nr:HlyD family efflux transporter periplasmic adaptor subunit [Oscillospiraceae bacterium]